MNRRIVLIDEVETPNYMSYFGIGLGDEIYTIQTLKNLDEVTRTGVLDLGEGDAAMLVGSEPFTYLRQFYHYGVRSENYFDCSKLYRLAISSGAYVKVIIDFPNQNTINEFMSPDFTIDFNYDWFKSDIIHTFARALKFLDWVDSLPEDEHIGFDYEGSGMPLDRWYELSGFSICNIQYGAFVSLTDIRHELGVIDTETSDNEKYNYLRKRVANTLYKRMSKCWTYNSAYEYHVSHRMLYGVDLYNLCDASVINTITGNHLKKYSLKWSGQYYLKAKVWDYEFDYLSDLIDQMLFTEVGKLKKDKQKVLKVDKDNFEQTPEWAEICKRYPQYVDEFRSLILEYWGNAFMCIPSDILGKYCNLDAFYTLLLYKSQENNYSKECFDTFLDNQRLSVRLGNGLYIDENYRKAYDIYSNKQMAFGITYCTLARCWAKMMKHKAKMADISKYSPVAVKLLKEGKFFQGNSLEIIKYILSTNIDYLDAYDTGLDEGKLAMTYGFDFAEKLVDAAKIRMKEIKMKTKIDDGIIRKKKLLGLLSEDIKPILGLDKIKIDDKHIELEKYSYYERNYQEIKKVSETQLTDINNIPEEIYAFGKKITVAEYSEFLSKNLFRCTSPEDNDEIVYEFMSLYKPQTCYLAAMFDSTQQLPEAEKFYSSREIDRIEDGFAEWWSEFNQFYPNATASRSNWKGEVKYTSTWHSQIYPDKAFTLAIDHSNSMKIAKKVTKSGTSNVYSVSDRAKEIWSDFIGWNAQAQYFPKLIDEYREYSKPFEPEDYNNDFFFIRKFVLNYLIFKKHSKVSSTYTSDTAMLKKTSKWVLVDDKHIPIREADPDEPGAVEKLFIHYECQTKSSKRWSSPFHTIISHSDLKNAICVPPTKNPDGSFNYNGGDYLLSYFDISSAEIKSAGYCSGSPEMIQAFEEGRDVYIMSAKNFLGEDHWNSLGKKDQKSWRKKMKTTTLGILYGLGTRSLSERLNCTEEDAQRIVDGIFNTFSGLKEYVTSQQRVPFVRGDGTINTMLGDRLKISPEWDLYQKATDARERNNLKARIERLGVNLVIQGGTSTIMQSGFFQDCRASIVDKWSTPLQIFITVHDSNTSCFPVEKVFDIIKFYTKNFTGHCKNITPHISLLWDINVGCRYEDASGMTQIDDDTIEFTGNAKAILEIYDKIMNCKNLNVECSHHREDIVPKFVEDAMLRFIKENGTSMIKDESSYKVRFHRINNLVG